MASINAVTAQFIKKSTVQIIGSPVVGVLYAAATKGPILLTAGCAVTAAAVNVAVGLILLALQKHQIISHSTAVILRTLSNTLTITALIVTGIALGIIGPVAIGCLTAAAILNLIYGLVQAKKISKMQKLANTSQQAQGQAQLQSQQIQNQAQLQPQLAQYAQSQAQLLSQQKEAQSAKYGLQNLIHQHNGDIQSIQNNVANLPPAQAHALQTEMQQLLSEMIQLQNQYAGINLEDPANLQELRNFQTTLSSLDGKQQQALIRAFEPAATAPAPLPAAQAPQAQPSAVQTPPPPQPALSTPPTPPIPSTPPSATQAASARPSSVQTPPTSLVATQTLTQSFVAPLSPTLSLLAKLEIETNDAATRAKNLASTIPASSKNATAALQKATLVKNAAKTVASQAVKAKTANTSTDRARLHSAAISVANGAKVFALALEKIAKEEAEKSK